MAPFGEGTTLVLGATALGIVLVILLLKDRASERLRPKDKAIPGASSTNWRIKVIGAVFFFLAGVSLLAVHLYFPDQTNSALLLAVIAVPVVTAAAVLWKIWPVRRLLWLILRAKLGLPNKQLTWISGELATGGIIECPACRNPIEVAAYQPGTIRKCGKCGIEIVAGDPPAPAGK